MAPIIVYTVILLCLFLGLFLAFRHYRVHLYAWHFGFPQPLFRVIVERNVMVPMLDGVQLAADVYRPQLPGKYPVIVARTPYNKMGNSDVNHRLGELFAGQGYVVVVQDVRGKFASEGKFLPYFHEALDGHMTITWAGTAPWSNGKVALVGASYLGSCAWLATQYRNPHLRTIIPMFTTSDTFSIWMDHGLPYLKGPLTWLSLYSEKLNNKEFSYAKIEPGLWKLPVKELDLLAAGHPIPFYREYLSHNTPDPFWEKISLHSVDNMNIPALIIGGWYDPFLQGTIEDFQRMAQSSSVNNRQSQLLIGPWAHNPALEFKGVNFGKTASVGMLMNACLKWCDQWLKLHSPAMSLNQKVRYFVMGRNAWKEAQQWPHENVGEEKLFLSGEEGRLSQSLSALTHNCHYHYNPRDPSLFRGRYLLYSDGWIAQVLQEEIGHRNDIVVFTSDLLEEELSIAGTVKLILHVSSSAPDTDFCAKLSDVHPNGKTYNLSPGFLRMRYRESLSNPQMMEPGEIYRVEISFRPLAHVFLKGHRLQLQVSSSDFPIHNRNLNTGMSCEDSTEIREAEQTLYTGGAYDSHLLFPVHRH